MRRQRCMHGIVDQGQVKEMDRVEQAKQPLDDGLISGCGGRRGTRS